MIKTRMICSICAVASILSAGDTANSQDKNEAPEDMTAPSTEHKEMANYAGDWDIEMHFVSDKENVYSGSSTNVMLVGNRFLQIQFSAKNTSSDVEGVFILGFDRRNLKYQMLGMDSWGTYYVTALGERSEQGGAIKLYGKDDDPNMKKMGYEKEFGYTCNFESENKFVIEIIFIDTRTDARNEIKFMVYKFSRADN